MSVPVSIKIDVRVGPATIRYESSEGDELFHIEDSAFIQRVMDLMRYVGSPDAPPDGPTPVLRAPGLVSPSPYGISPADSAVVVESTLLQVETEMSDLTVDDLSDEDLYEGGDDSGVLPSGSRVARVGGTSFASNS